MSGAATAAVEARLRVSRLLSTADCDPGLPASAILVVRRLEDPLPQSLRADRSGVRPPPEWERAVRTSLERAWRDAARPWSAPVPAHASAVLFRDPAEMLATLALDAAAGRLPRRWWWRALLRSPTDRGPRGLARAWIREARHVPAALALIERRGALASVARAFGPEEAGAVLDAVVASHGFTDLRHALADARPDRTPDGSPLRPAEDPAVASRPGAAVAPPWAGLIPESAVTRATEPEVRALLCVGLAMARAPLRVGGAAFATATKRWRAAQSEPYPGRSEPRPRAARTPPDLRDGGRDGPDWTGDHPEGQSLGEAASPTGGAGPVAVAQLRAAGAPRPGLPPPGTDPAREQGPVPHAATPAPPAGAEAGPVPETGTPTPSTPGGSHAGALHDIEAHSGLCGVFFLVNALVGTGWFGRAPDSMATGWGWLEIVARELVGPRAPLDDPIWRVLAVLDGRRIDDEPRPPALGAGAQSFLEEALPPLRRRLRLALRTRGGRGGLQAALLRRDGSIRAGPTHVDVRMPLDQVTLPVRTAGLDIDPGWVPALARVVTFHFGTQP